MIPISLNYWRMPKLEFDSEVAVLKLIQLTDLTLIGFPKRESITRQNLVYTKRLRLQENTIIYLNKCHFIYVILGSCHQFINCHFRQSSELFLSRCIANSPCTIWYYVITVPRFRIHFSSAFTERLKCGKVI